MVDVGLSFNFPGAKTPEGSTLTLIDTSEFSAVATMNYVATSVLLFSRSVRCLCFTITILNTYHSLLYSLRQYDLQLV